MVPGRRRRRRTPGLMRQAGCMAKTEKRQKPQRLPKQIDAAVQAADDKQAKELVVLDLRKAAGFTDYFVICSGTNTRQMRAIADAVIESLSDDGRQAGAHRGLRPLRVDSARLLRFHRARLRPGDADVLRPRAPLGQRRAHRSSRQLTRRCSDAPAGKARGRSERTSRAARLRICHRHAAIGAGRCPVRRARARLRRVRRAARTAHARPGLRRLLALDPAAHTAALRLRCGDPLPTWRDQRNAGRRTARAAAADARRSIARGRSASTTARCARSSTR